MKLIPLTKGFYAIVDDEDYQELMKHKWYANKEGKTYYAVRNVRIDDAHQTAILMHRQIMNAQAGQQIDHRNHRGYDNRRANIRLCTHSQNCFNMQPRSGSSCYKGVSWNKQMRKWTAQIKCNKKNSYLGYFDDEREAALAYDVAAKECFGDFAYLNFPELGAF